MYIVKRAAHNPLISPVSDHPWEARGTFNPSPVKVKTMTHVLYRAVGRPDALQTPSAGISTIGKGISVDGEHVQNRRQFIIPEEPWERFGCEDPRVTYFEGKYYIFYTALSEFPFHAGGIKVAVAISKDLEAVTERHLVTPFNAKAFALFPKRINGKVVGILTAHTDEPPAKLAIVECDEIADLWNEDFWKSWHERIDEHRINPLRFDHDHLETGAAPIETKYGWLVIYSYIQNYFGGGKRVFGIEALLLDKKNPHEVIGRTKGPIMVPEEIYERYGATADVVFPSGALLHDNGILDIYYGAADTVSAKASLNMEDLISGMIPEKQRTLVERYAKNPIITPDPRHAWEARATFNTGAIDIGGTIHLFYRAMSEDNTSVFGYAATKNGFAITKRLPDPVYTPREDFEMKKGSSTGNSGCEDPRLTQIGERVYMTYTAYDGVHPTRIALTSIKARDLTALKFDRFTSPILISPENVDDKNMCFLKKKIKGEYMLLHRIGSQICADFLPGLDFKTKRINRCIEVMGPRDGMWDSEKIGITGPPIETSAGWLLIYHGVSKTKTYRLGAVLLDKNNPTVVIARTVHPIFEPTETYEKVGQMPNVVFSCGVIRRADTLFIYYGGADSVVGVATLSVKSLLAILRPKNLT